MATAANGKPDPIDAGSRTAAGDLRREPEDDSLLELRSRTAVVAAAERMTRLRGWSYHVASGSFEWVCDAGNDRPASGRQARRISMASLMGRIHPEDRPVMERLAQAVLHEGLRRFTYRYRFVVGTDRTRFLSGDGEAVVDSDGKVRRVVGIVMDVTGREAPAEAAPQGSAGLGVLESASPAWLWEQDEELRFTSFSRTRDRVLNKDHDLALGQCRWDAPPGALPCTGTWEEHRKVLNQRLPFHDFEYRACLSNGDERVFATSGVPTYADDGRFVGYCGTALDITPLYKARDAAARTQSLLQMASRLGHLGAWAVDRATRRGEWSPELLNIYDLQEDQKVTPELLDGLVLEKYRSAFQGAIQACETKGQPVDVEVEALTAKGRAIWVRLRAEAVRDESGAILRTQGATQDVTDRKRDAELLVALNRQLVNTFESIAHPFVTVDRQLRLTYVNGEAVKRSRMPREVLLGKSLAEQFPAFAGSVFQQEFDRALREGTPGIVEALATAFGRWLNVSVFPSEQGLALYIRDVTERKEARRRLELSEERYRLLFETSADGILRVRPDGRIRQANRAACDMFGRTAAEMQSLSSEQLVASGDERVKAMVRQRLEHGGARGELTMLRADGSTFEAEANTSTFANAEGEVFINLVVRDITERVVLQRRLETLNEELAEKVRQRTRELERANAELTGFARSLAHDLLQPVAAARSLGLAVEMHLAKDEASKAARYAAQLNESVRWMGDYVNALMSLTRISRASLALEPVDLSALAAGLMEEMRKQQPARRAKVEIQPRLHAVGDRTLLRLLLQNLLGNAWKFTGRKEEARIAFTARPSAGGDVVYTVEDNGAGFDPRHAERMFETFQRFHKSGEFPGTGIGLANASKIVERHGGRIWAESEPGQGARFHFTLAAGAAAGR